MSMRASVGNGGWVRFELDGRHVFVRFESTDDGRLEVADLFIPGRSTARQLREIPLNQLEAWANSPALADSVRVRMGIPGPQLATAASYYAATIAPGNWVGDMLDPAAEPVAPARRTTHRREPAAPPAQSAVLEVPEGRAYGEDFYRQVADRYRALTSAGIAPGPAISEANGVAVTQVHRWVRQARKLGFLPAKGTPGRVG